jgi:hypothetical protein
MTVIVDPIESFEDVVLGGCSGASVAASALAASDTWPGKKIRAPTLGSSGRPIETFNPASPEVSAFSGRAMPLLISRLRLTGSMKNSPNTFVALKSSAIYCGRLSSNVIPES